MSEHYFCTECEARNLTRGACGCGPRYTRECGDEGSLCPACESQEWAYWSKYFGDAPARANQARRDLDLPADAADAAVMAAARMLK